MPDVARILINGSFRGQRITGQQRYATEIASRLLGREGVRERSPEPAVPRSAVSAWVNAQFAGFGRAPGERLLTLTSRGPLVVRRHVVVVHDLFVLDHPEWYSRKYVATHAPVLRAQLRSAELVLAVSDPVAHRSGLLARVDTPVVTVPNAPAELFQPGRDDPGFLDTKGLTSGRYILAVSSADPRKNLERLVEGHSALPESMRREYPLVLVGGTSGIYAHTDRISGDRVIRLGYVSDDELARLYAGAALVAFPSLDEGFGLPAVEALASGSDILVSETPALRWVCEDFAHYADPLSVASITATMRAALESPSDRDERESRADAIRSRFSWQQSADTVYSAISMLSQEQP